ncbi:hypothetical protein IHV25_09655 [Phaeovibrio sulfidiphilus]|uniref:Uncharacterized protein n=1 Tax=Phaeovibrio sulfidiphilus TaxID=1220600 RepID=A0A8J7CQ70_9PROT|nr:hypothetical protein [Phaeovibrio sulfidiphilus]MBE1237907.1 hypothetical protein [Phaeovibrio sulfidiphilus]
MAEQPFDPGPQAPHGPGYPGAGRGRRAGDGPRPPEAEPAKSWLLSPGLYQRILVWAGILALTALAVMLLWNALMPGIAGVPRLDYLQAAGLLVLCRLLFGGLSGGLSAARPVSRAGDRLQERWGAMSPGERREFQRRRRQRCGCDGDGHGEGHGDGPGPGHGHGRGGPLPGATADSAE